MAGSGRGGQEGVGSAPDSPALGSEPRLPPTSPQLRARAGSCADVQGIAKGQSYVECSHVSDGERRWCGDARSGGQW